MEELTAAQIKQAFPKEWERLQREARASQKSQLPVAEEKRLRRQVGQLQQGRLMEYGPTARFPFVARLELLWEELDFCSFTGFVSVRPRKEASQAEKRLIKLLLSSNYGRLSDHILEDLLDEAAKAPEVKAYNQEIKAWYREAEALAEKYNFNVDDLL